MVYIHYQMNLGVRGEDLTPKMFLFLTHLEAALDAPDQNTVGRVIIMSGASRCINCQLHNETFTYGKILLGFFRPIFCSSNMKVLNFVLCVNFRV